MERAIITFDGSRGNIDLFARMYDVNGKLVQSSSRSNPQRQFNMTMNAASGYLAVTNFDGASTGLYTIRVYDPSFSRP